MEPENLADNILLRHPAYFSLKFLKDILIVMNGRYTVTLFVKYFVNYAGNIFIKTLHLRCTRDFQPILGKTAAPSGTSFIAGVY